MWTDLRHTLRLLVNSPGFTSATVLSLALGIGLNTAIFSVIYGVWLRPAPIDDLERLVLVWETDRNTGTTREPASYPDFLDFRERSRSLSALIALMAGEQNLTPPAGDPIRLAALRVTGGALPMLGVSPIAGRTFTEQEDQPGAAPVVVISRGLWRRLFNEDPGALGQSLRLDDVPHEIVGIVPDATDFGVMQVLTQAAYARSFADRGVRTRVDVWTPLRATPEQLPRQTHPIFVIGRLADGARVEGAQTELAAIAADLERDYPVNAGRGVNVQPLQDVVFGPVRPALILMWVGVALVLLVACTNVANLLLARGTSRRRDIAIRTALGSGTSRLARQFVMETLVLTGVAAAAGVGLAYAALAVFVAQAPPDVPRIGDVSLDRAVLGVTALVSVIVGLVFGIVPTLQALAVDPSVVLRGEPGRGAAGSLAGQRARRGLVVAELALAVVLVVSAGLLIRSFWALQAVDTGFRASGVVKAEYQLPASRYPVTMRTFPDFPAAHAFTARLIESARQLPEIEHAAVAGNHPLDPGFTNSFAVVGRRDEALPEISVRRVTPGYFDTVGLGLTRGRTFTEMDGTSSPAVALINEAAAARLFPETDPLGQQLRMWGSNRTIVGVVGNERFQGIAEPAPIALYLPLSQAPSTTGAGVLLLRGAGDVETLSAAAQRLVRSIDPNLAVFGVEPLDHTVARAMGEERFIMWLLALFAGLALVLAAIGVHGVLSYSVARRTQEIGIRIALGATPPALRRQVVGEALMLTVAGMTVGLLGALALSVLMRHLLFGVSAVDPLTYVAVCLVLLSVAWLASAIPAYRATTVDPVEAMRV